MMRKVISLIVAVATLWLVAACSTTRILLPESEHVAGHYTYVLSWDCPGPDNMGNTHVDEEGSLEFRPDGTFVDHALQHHYLYAPDSSSVECFDFDYYCEGDWKAEEGKYKMREHSKGFKMELHGAHVSEGRYQVADKIFKYYCPRDRWVTYDIERLDRRWFVWSRVYPQGNKMYWRMKRTR